MSLPSFKLAILVPVFSACFVWGAMYQSGLPDICWSPDCFNNAFELFKVPLAILALIFPAVALVASHHRSVQTAAQIERAESQIALTDAKNSFENYFKHQEHFSSFVKDVGNKGSIRFEFNTVRDLYKEIFPENKTNNFHPFDRKGDFFINQFNAVRRMDESFGRREFSDEDYDVVKNELTFILIYLKIDRFTINHNNTKKIIETYSLEPDNEDGYEKLYEYFYLKLRLQVIELLSDLYSFSIGKKIDRSELLTFRELRGYRKWSRKIYSKDIEINDAIKKETLT